MAANTPNTFSFLTFEQWKAINADLLDEVNNCPTCNGTGEHECDCGDVHECCDCNGSGKTADLHSLYIRQKRKDQKHLRDWLKSLGIQTAEVLNA